MRKTRDAVARKNEILDVAAELFVLKGYDKTSTGDILEKTGIARGTLYYHFKSKEELLDALVDRIVDCNQTVIRSFIIRHNPALPRIH